MCGIAGCYQQPDGEALARTMINRMVHRGPDDAGYFNYQREEISVQLAHRRLSIIDLSAGGRQPLTVDGLTLCYNGELYNYRTLRAELTGLGVRFSTNSDNEVVLEAWRRWGPACLKRFRGMFAFALFNDRTGDLVLARDQLGIKPLHYLSRNNGVVFASELKGIVTALSNELVADPCALVASLLYYWVPPGRCAVKDVQKLAPGTWVEFRPDGTSIVNRYWDIAEVAAEAAAGPPADLRTVINESVEAHMVADVPVSCFLSGGLDSSIVTVLAKQRDSAVDAYTITYRPEDHRLEAMPDDAVYARKVAARFGIKLHEIETSPDVANLLPRIVDILDEPVGDPAAINTLLMCETARDAGVKVVLSGMGADEPSGATANTWPASWQAGIADCRRRCAGRCGAWPTTFRWSPGGGVCATSAGQSASSPSVSSPRRPPFGAAIPFMIHRIWPPSSAPTSALVSPTWWRSTMPSMTPRHSMTRSIACVSPTPDSSCQA